MKTRVRIIPKKELRALGIYGARWNQVEIAIKTAASELGGKLVEEITAIDEHRIYAMPKRQRREKVGFIVNVTQISERYVYAEI